MPAKRARPPLAVLCPLCRAVSTHPADARRSATLGHAYRCRRCAAISTRPNPSAVAAPPDPPGVDDVDPPNRLTTRLITTSTPSPTKSAYPDEATQGVIEHLTQLGFVGARSFAQRYPLEIVAEAIAQVQAALDRGAAIDNPGALIRWTVYQSVGQPTQAELRRRAANRAANRPPRRQNRSA